MYLNKVLSYLSCMKYIRTSGKRIHKYLRLSEKYIRICNSPILSWKNSFPYISKLICKLSQNYASNGELIGILPRAKEISKRETQKQYSRKSSISTLRVADIRDRIIFGCSNRVRRWLIFKRLRDTTRPIFDKIRRGQGTLVRSYLKPGDM